MWFQYMKEENDYQDKLRQQLNLSPEIEIVSVFGQNVKTFYYMSKSGDLRF